MDWCALTRRGPSEESRPSKEVVKRSRLTHAQSIERQQNIVHAYDVKHQTFGQIARDLGMGEKEVRDAYARYVRDIAPLLNVGAPDEEAAQYLRKLEDVGQQLRGIAATADNDSVRVGALREYVKVLCKVIELRQHFGLLPTPLPNIRMVAEQRWMGQQIAVLLAELNAPPDSVEKLIAILSGEIEG